MAEKAEKAEKKGSFFKRHKILTVIGVIIVIAVIASTANGGNKNGNTTADSSKNSSSSGSKKSATLAKIGQPADDGKFAFTVNSVKCGETQVGGQYLNKTAQGQYCRMNVSVKNIGNEAQTLDTTSQYLYNASGQKYSSDSTATIYAAPNSNDPWEADVNPGNTITGDILFDVPKGVTPVTAELHDSSFSGGVKVSLQ